MLFLKVPKEALSTIQFCFKQADAPMQVQRAIKLAALYQIRGELKY